jgi:putative addiction module component (TIGR02574 family)
MTARALWDEILRLPIKERLKLVQDIWDTIAVTPEEVPVPDCHKEELDRRLDHPEPGPNLSWDQVRERLPRPPAE